ncbi:hypothetical protein N327_09898, partial [Fulmarus glacialis]
SLTSSVFGYALYSEDPLTLSQSPSKSVPAFDKDLPVMSFFMPSPHFHSAKTQFAINWKKFTGFWANSTPELLGSNISQYARVMSLPLSSKLISCCFTVPK